MAGKINREYIPIAIVGMGCRFPGDATSPSKFWDMISKGKDAHSSTSSRWNSDALYHSNSRNRANTLATKGGHFLKEDPYRWDASFFSITSAEANAMDPKQRIVMELTYEALENAGLPMSKVAGTQTACYIGSSTSDYRDMVTRDFGNWPKYYILGNCEEMISNRVSHFFDIHGPSATIQSACSSSLVATHLACQSLQSEESEMAITGGVGLMLTPDGNIQLANLTFLNPDGHSRSFSDDAGGYGRGEGAGILVLKRLDKALKDGNPIRAVIRASGANSDGWTQGVTLPSKEAQAALIKYVYESNGLDYSETQYVEAHGTGTAAGDPLEASTIHSTIGSGATKARKLLIGSVKPNIGHLEAAAGVAGIIKGVLAMEHNLIPPNIYFNKPNPAIPFEEWNMAVPTKLTPWPACKTKRMSISGFGMGGTNGHVVLESFSPKTWAHLLPASAPVYEAVSNKKRVFVFSSHDQVGFKRIAEKLFKHMEELGPAASSPGFLANLAHTLAVARSGLSWKWSCVAETAAELCHQLSVTVGSESTRTPETQPRIGFVFTGQGAQWAGMGTEMLKSHPVFRESVARSSSLLKSFGCDWDPVEELSRPKDESRLKMPSISQPICTLLQIALIDELHAWGVVPNKVVGHSSGEIAAAYSAGILTHHDAIKIAYLRGKVSSDLCALRGGMMAVGCSHEQVNSILEQYNKGHLGGMVAVACVNSPSSVTLSGDSRALEKLRGILEVEKIFARMLKVDVAYHSSHMQRVAGEYAALMSDIEPKEFSDDDGPSRRRPIIVSSVTGSEVVPEMMGAYYWVRNLVSPVLFEGAIKEMVSRAAAENEIDAGKSLDILVELGPHGALGGPIQQIISHHGFGSVNYISALTRLRSSTETILELAAALFAQGVPLHVQRVNGDSNCQLLTNLPSYPWNHSKAFRCDSRIAKELLGQSFDTRSLLGAPLPMMDETQCVWRSFIRLEDEPWLRGHTVGDTVLLPGAAMTSIILEASQQLVATGKKARAFRLRDVSLLAAMALPEGVAVELIVHMRPFLQSTLASSPSAWWEFTMSSCITGDQLRDNCRGLMTIDYVEETTAQMAKEDAIIEASRVAEYHRVHSILDHKYPKENFYAHMNSASWRYGEIFRGIEGCRVGDGRSTFDIKITDIGETYSSGKHGRPFLIHAGTLDAVFQSWLSSTWKGGKDGGFAFTRPFVPVHLTELEISAEMPGDVGHMLRGLCFSRRYGFTDLSADMFVYDQNVSKPYLVVKDFRVAELNMDDGGGQEPSHLDPTDITGEIRWNYALDIVEPQELCRIMSAIKPKDKMTEMIKMILHLNPGARVLEVVLEQESTPKSVIKELLSEGILYQSQVHYIVVNPTTTGFIDKQQLGLRKSFHFESAIDPSIGASPKVDLVIIPSGLDKMENRHQFINRVLELAKPDATVLVATSQGRTAPESIDLGAKRSSVEFQVDKTKSLFLYRTAKQESTPKITAASRRVVILEPLHASHQGLAFSQSLQDILRTKGYSLSMRKLPDGAEPDVAENDMMVSLLELETPLLHNLAEEEYNVIKRFSTTFQRILWLTGGTSPSFGIIDGLSRCVQSEIAGTRFQVLHLSAATGMQHGPSLAARILSSQSIRDDEFHERDGALQVTRIYRSLAENKAIRDHLVDRTRLAQISSERDLRLTIERPGLLDTLQFITDDRLDNANALADHEVEIKVAATGINFRDIMAAMGLIPMSVLGQEGSGIVERVGSKAAGKLNVGDRVSFLGVGTHATRVRVDHNIVARIPDYMSFEEAASIPVTNTTAYHALVSLGRLSKGKSVLIHAAAGGIGQAAVQIAQHLGATIYVTVGSPEKQKLLVDLYGIPEEHVFNSRDTSFVKGISRVTNGRGVDCVLNSLSGDLLRASWETLAPFGTFVEIGMRDILENSRLDMRPFGKSATFTFFNQYALYQEDVVALGGLLDKVFDLIHRGTLRCPKPLTTRHLDQVEGAFRSIKQGKHMGKVVLSFAAKNAKAQVLRKAKDSLRLEPNVTYLLVGGLGGLGRSVARLFIASGARHLAFLSRSGDDAPDAKALLKDLSDRGAVVKAYRGDVSDPASFRAALDTLGAELPPIKGVIQMAMVLRDVVFEKMTYDSWRTGLRPKVQGTWNLHEYFGKSRPLDFFLIFSSISGLYGFPSQAQYAAGNTYQDTLAHYRRRQGLKAVSVNLGIMRDVGVLAEQGATGNFLLWEEALGIREPVFHALIKGLISRQLRDGPASWPPAQITTGLGTADIMTRQGLDQPGYFSIPRFAPLAVLSAATGASSKGGPDTVSLSLRLSEATTKEQATGIITQSLVQKLADILQIPVSEVDPTRPMYRYGVDSLVALEVRNWITNEIKTAVALLEVLAAVPIQVFAARIAEKSKLVLFE